MSRVQAMGGQQQPVPTLLGQGAARFPIGGRIRAGVKVLTAAAAQEPKAKAVYDAGVAAGKSFDEIEAEIVRAVPELRHPLVPKNVPYFTVRRGDFAMAEVADRILALFGEDRGDGCVRLYRFPIVFPADRWEAIMPHALMCYGASELKYWSAYSADGRERYCMAFAPVPVDNGGKRTIRIFGGRKHVTRDANGGRCEPERCPEYQARQCNLTGRFIFLIPGVPSIHPIELATNSFYAMNAARQTLETVGFLRGGRIGGFLEGRTSFWITKRLHEVSMIGEDGTPRRVPQWLIELEAPIDLTRLLAVDSDETRIEEGERAAALLAGASPDVVEPLRDADGEPASAACEQNTERVPRLAPVASSNRESAVAVAPVGEDALAQVFERVSALQLSREAFESYAKRKYGAGWNLNPSGIRRVLKHLQAFRGDGASLLAAVDGALDAVN